MDDTEIVVHLFCCANSVTESEAQALRARFGVEGMKLLSLPCSGKATLPYLLKALEKGADGVAIITCVQGECRHLEGNLRSSRRARAADALAEEIGLGRGRVLAFEKEQGSVEKMIETMERFRETLGEMRDVGCGDQALPIARLPKPDSDAADRQETAA